MKHEPITVEVKVSYNTVAETKDLKLATKILSMILEHNEQHPETPQERLERTLREQIEKQDSELYDLRQQLKALQPKPKEELRVV